MILAAIAGLAGNARTPLEMMPKWSAEPEETPDVIFARMQKAFEQ